MVQVCRDGNLLFVSVKFLYFSISRISRDQKKPEMRCAHSCLCYCCFQFQSVANSCRRTCYVVMSDDEATLQKVRKYSRILRIKDSSYKDVSTVVAAAYVESEFDTLALIS